MCALTINPANIRLDEDVFRLRLQKTSSRRLDQDQYIRLGHTSSRRRAKMPSRHLEDVSRRLQDIFNTSCKDVFNTFSRCTIKLICSW